MRGIVGGEVVEVEFRSYLNQANEKVETFDAYVRDGRFTDRISGPAELAPKAGETAQYVALLRAKKSKAGKEYLSVWAVERVTVEAKPYASPLAVAK